MVKLAEKALTENRVLNAAFYYRAAEFYVLEGDEPGKEYYYDKFIDLFYRAVEGESFERISIPYDTGFLPALRIEQKIEKEVPCCYM